MPTTSLQGDNLALKKKRRKLMLDSLRFDEAESRRATIRRAHFKTCDWLLQQTDYQSWLDLKPAPQNHGFLWIKGKPGTGKSTIMKFILSDVEKSMAEQCHSTSFFFNTRGTELEKSITRMYRSLLVQLLEKLTELQGALDLLELPWNGEWDIEVPKDTFRMALRDLGREHLFCIIDALDECPEDEVRDLVKFFEDLGHTGVLEQKHLYICFSSRHYPHISISIGLQHVLEDQEGQSNDIKSYLSAELKAGKSKQVEDIKSEILKKASGIFPRVVLVVQILNKEYDRGQIYALRKRLQEIPTQLNELFKDILTKDSENVPGLLLCIQWILYASRPLTEVEFYFAILSGQVPQSLGAWDAEEITPQDMERFIISSSKGLAEITRFKPPTVQFIHESVREFLLQNGTLFSVWPGFESIAEGPGHDQLKSCCYNYMRVKIPDGVGFTTRLSISSESISSGPISAGSSSPEPFPPSPISPGSILPESFQPEPTTDRSRRKYCESFPFLEYAVNHVLYHADVAERNGVAQSDFIERFHLDVWIEFANSLEEDWTRRYSRGASLLYICADRDLPNLIKIQHRGSSILDSQGEFYESVILAAAANGSRKGTKALLMPQPHLKSSLDPTLLDSQFDHDLENLVNDISWYANVRHWDIQTLIPFLAVRAGPLIFELLIQNVVDIESKDDDDRTPLWRAASTGDETVVKWLIEHGAKHKMKDSRGYTPLSEAAMYGHKAVVKLLIEAGAGIDSRTFGYTPLWEAAVRGDKSIVQILIEAGADIDSKDTWGYTPLFVAAERGTSRLLRCLFMLEQRLTRKMSRGSHHYRRQLGMVIKMLLACSLMPEQRSIPEIGMDIPHCGGQL